MERYKMYLPINPIVIDNESVTDLDELEISVWHEGSYGVAVSIMPCSRNTMGVRHIFANDKVKNIMLSACPMRKGNTKKLEKVWNTIQKLSSRIVKMYDEVHQEGIMKFMASGLTYILYLLFGVFIILPSILTIAFGASIMVISCVRYGCTL